MKKKRGRPPSVKTRALDIENDIAVVTETETNKNKKKRKQDSQALNSNKKAKN